MGRKVGLILTILLGMMFTSIQAYEYSEILHEKLFFNEYTPMNSYYAGSLYENPNNPKNQYDQQGALALLADHFGDDAKALVLTERFMREVVSVLDNAWQLTGEEIDAALAVVELAVLYLVTLWL